MMINHHEPKTPRDGASPADQDDASDAEGMRAEDDGEDEASLPVEEVLGTDNDIA